MTKIETLTDSFTSLTNWRAEAPSYTSYFPNYSVAGGELIGDMTNVVSLGAAVMVSTGTYTFEDSWFSLEVTDFHLDGVAYYVPFELTAFDESTETQYDSVQLFVDYPTAGQTTIQAAAANGTFPTPISGSIVIAGRCQTGVIYGFYSFDSGSTWTQVGDGSVPTARPDDSPLGMLIISELIGNSSTDVLVKASNFNLYEPPMGIPTGPTDIAITTPAAEVDVNVGLFSPGLPIIVPSAHVTVTAAPLARVLFDGLFVGSRFTTDGTAYTDVTVTPPVIGLGINITLLDAAPVIISMVATITGIVYGSPEFHLSPAVINVAARAPLSISMSGPAPVIAVPPAYVEVIPHISAAIVGAFVVGDIPEYPISIRDSGTGTYDLSIMTHSDTFIDPEFYARTMWFEYTSDAAMTVTFAAGGVPSGKNLHFGTVEQHDPEDPHWFYTNPPRFLPVNVDDFGTYSFDLDVPKGKTMLWVGTNYTTSPFDFTLTWSFVPKPSPLLFDIKNPSIDRTPDNIRGAVQGAYPFEPIKFFWSPPVSTLIPGSTTRPITLATINADFEGNVATATLMIPAAFHGDYAIEAIGQTSGNLAIDNFSIKYDPLPQDSDSVDTDPVPQVGTKWLWDDALGATWVMTNSPDTMTSLILPKTLLNDRTTSGSGQQVIWRGLTPAFDWSFNGVVRTEAEYNQLVYFYNLKRKFYITNHRNNTYVVTIKNLDLTPHREPGNNWCFNYSVTALIYGKKG